MTRPQKALLFALFILACLFLGRASIFQSFEGTRANLLLIGQDRMPFQGRMLMLPYLRFCMHSSLLAHVHLDRMTPVSVGFFMLHAVCIFIMGLLALHLGRILGLPRRFYYLPCLFTLIAIAFTNCIHQEWNPYAFYDFASYTLFALGLWAIVSRRNVLFVLIAAVAMINKETILLLIPVWIAWSLQEEEWSFALLKTHWKLFAGAFVLGIALLAEERTAIYLLGYDRTAIGFAPPWHFSTLSFLLPQHLPQVFSPLAFSIPVVFLFRKYLSRPIWCLLMGIFPGILLICYSAVPLETRVYGEFVVVIAVILSFEFAGYIEQTASRPA